MKIEQGKQYRYTGFNKPSSLGWFAENAILTITQVGEDGSHAAIGPARDDGCGGHDVKAGEPVRGYVRTFHLAELEVASSAVFSESVTTTITVPRALTEAEREAIRKIVGV